MGGPRAILLDLDDTILDDSSLVTESWREACASHAERLGPFPPDAVADAVRHTSKWFWGDSDRHRVGRLDLNAARREVARLALLDLGIADAQLAADIGDAYSRRRDVGMAPVPDAIETVRWLRGTGVRLALLTNGAGPAQRKKIERFGLARVFDTILVEGELDWGKPDERIYRRALDDLEAQASDAWMIGDNLEWDVAAPQRLGMVGIWIDWRRHGLPADATVRPDHIVSSLAEVQPLMRAGVTGRDRGGRSAV